MRGWCFRGLCSEKWGCQDVGIKALNPSASKLRIQGCMEILVNAVLGLVLNRLAGHSSRATIAFGRSQVLRCERKV